MPPVTVFVSALASTVASSKRWQRLSRGLAAVLIWPAGLSYSQPSLPPSPTEALPQLRISIADHSSTPIIFRFVPEPRQACFSFLAGTMGSTSHDVIWRAVAPFGKISISKLGVEKAKGLTKSFLVLDDGTPTVAWPKRGRGNEGESGKTQEDNLEEAPIAGLYLARQSGQAYGDTLIITKGLVQGIDAKHLLCAVATAPKKALSSDPLSPPLAQLWQIAPAEDVPVRIQLDYRGHKPQGFAYLPALSRSVAKELTHRTARKAASSMAATFDLNGARALHLATFQRQGTLIQVNYTVSFGKKKRKLTLIGGYTNSSFTPKHLHFSR